MIEQVITARCYGGPAHGEWMTIRGRYLTIPCRSREATLRTFDYVALYLRPPGWRIAFPIFVPASRGTAMVVAELDLTYSGHAHVWLPGQSDRRWL